MREGSWVVLNIGISQEELMVLEGLVLLLFHGATPLIEQLLLLYGSFDVLFSFLPPIAHVLLHNQRGVF